MLWEIPIRVQCILDMFSTVVGVEGRECGERLDQHLVQVGRARPGLCSPALLHGVDELCCLGVAKVAQAEGRDVESAHHVVVLVDKVVAVEHVDAVPGSVLRHNLQRLVWPNHANIFHACSLVRHHLAAPADPLYNLKVDKVDMNG